LNTSCDSLFSILPLGAGTFCSAFCATRVPDSMPLFV